MEEKLIRGTGLPEDGSRAGAKDLAEAINAGPGLSGRDWSQYSPLSLAWIGDTVYDLIIRSILLEKGNRKPDQLHRMASAIVNARAQAALMRKIRHKLSDQEQQIYRRGRNAKPAHKAKNADMAEYLEATAFECLVGWLYLTRQYERLLALVRETCDEEKEQPAKSGGFGYGT